MKMDLVVGGGPVQGCEPVEYLQKEHRDFVVVDTDSHCLTVRKYRLKQSSTIDATGEFFIQGDLVTSLALLTKIRPEYVFPTIPIHLVTEMAKIKFRLKPWKEAIDKVLPYLPQAVVVRVGRGELAVSFNRDNDCLEKCEAPQAFSYSRFGEKCTMDRLRPCTMDQLMRYACPEGFILFSHTMSPGLGAFKGSEILDFLNWAERKENFVVATSCNCHGIFWGFKKAAIASKV
jgi:hypothetical protein